MDKATEKEVEMFLIAIAKNPPTMNLNGYANINRGLITSVISNEVMFYFKQLITIIFRMFHLWQPI